MAEYIERAETAEFFEKSKQTMWHKDDVAATISSKKNIPSADVVEVVRCKDCRIGKGNTPKMGAGWIYCENNGQYHKETHFCGYGERRLENEPT